MYILELVVSLFDVYIRYLYRSGGFAVESCNVRQPSSYYLFNKLTVE